MPDREKIIRGLERCLICTTSVIASEEGEKAYRDCEYTVGLYCRQDKLLRDVLSMLKEQEEIIHCKDCYYYHKPEYGFTIGDCTYRTAWYPVKENEFCSLAKRKEGR